MKKILSVFTVTTLVIALALSLTVSAATFSANWEEIKAYGMESQAEPENLTVVGDDGSFFTETADATRWWPQNYYIYKNKVNLATGIKSEIYARYDMALGSHYGISFSTNKVTGNIATDSYYPNFTKGFSIVLTPQANAAAEIPVVIRTVGIDGVGANIVTNLKISNDFATKNEIEIKEDQTLGYIIRVNGQVAKNEDNSDLNLTGLKTAMGSEVFLSYNTTFAGTSTGKFKLAKINGTGANNFVQEAATPGGDPNPGTADNAPLTLALFFISGTFVAIVIKSKKLINNKV